MDTPQRQLARVQVAQPSVDEALRKSELQLSVFVSHAPVSMAMFDRDLNYLATSDRWLVDYGLSGDIVGRNHYEIFPDLPERWKDDHRRCLAGATLKCDGELWARADGSAYWLSWAVLPWRDAKGAIGGIIMSTEDIRERKRVEQALRASEQKYLMIFERAPFAMALTRLPDRHFVAANDAFAQLFQFSREEVLGRTSTELQIVDHDAQAEVLAELLSRGSVRDFECTRSTKSGARLDLLLNMDWVDVAGQAHVLTTVRDITERKQAEQARERSAEVTRLYERSREIDAFRTRFFAGVSHELRTPLALILGPASQLREDPQLGEAARHKLDIILRNARTLRGHVEDLLDLSKVEAGEAHVDWTDVDVTRLVRLIASRFDDLAEERAIGWTLELAPLRAHLDAKMLSRVLSNLLSNAFKFTPAGGRVRVTTRQQGQHCVFEVADSGPGIPLDKREVIFDRFRQLAGGTTERFGGTGLGLSIVRELVGVQGGSVSVGDAPEGGASFTVFLPVVAPQGAAVRSEPADPEDAIGLLPSWPPPAEPAAPGAERAAQTSQSRTLVLIVEDNPDMSGFLQEVLAVDHRVEVAFDGREGLAKALEHRPDLVLADVSMPVMGGDALLVAMRQQKELAATPVIVLTAQASDQLRVQLLREGANDFLTKPFSPEELRVRVGNLIAQHRTLDALRNALSAVKTLSGLLPICSWCKCIRDDAGYWQSVENYVASRTDVKFTHGVCNACASELKASAAELAP